MNDETGASLDSVETAGDTHLTATLPSDGFVPDRSMRRIIVGAFWLMRACWSWFVRWDRRRTADQTARCLTALYPDRSGMVKSGPYGRAWKGKEVGSDSR